MIGKEEIKEFFSDLDFEKKRHLYSSKSTGRVYPSCSKVLKRFYHPFNADEVARKKGEREGINPEVLKAQWKKAGEEAAQKGTEDHEFGEIYPFYRNIDPKSPKQWAIKRFWDELPDHIIPIAVELRMYHKDYNYAGTLDILLYNTKTQKFIIADYKTNKDLFKNFRGKRLRGRFTDFLDTPYNKYQIQQNLYKTMIEQMDGVEIERMIIVHLLPDKTYDLYDCQDFSKELEESFK